MKYIILFVCVLVTGCFRTVPVRIQFPEAPEILQQKCPKLETVDNQAKLSDIAKSVVDNYVKYHECSARNDSWIEWYNSTRQNFNKTFNK